MLIKKESRSKVQIAKKGIVWDYPMLNKDIGISVQELNGRVPNSGTLRNKVCNEIVYIISGSGIIYIENEKYDVKEGDVVIIEPGKKSYTIANKLKTLTITSPDWYEEQCEETD